MSEEPLDPSEHRSGKSVRMGAVQAEVLTHFCCNSPLLNAHAFLCLLITAGQGPAELRHLAAEVADAPGKHSMFHCLQSRFLKLPLEVRNLDLLTEWKDIPEVGREAVHRLWRSTRSTANDAEKKGVVAGPTKEARLPNARGGNRKHASVPLLAAIIEQSQAGAADTSIVPAFQHSATSPREDTDGASQGLGATSESRMVVYMGSATCAPCTLPCAPLSAPGHTSPGGGPAEGEDENLVAVAGGQPEATRSRGISSMPVPPDCAMGPPSTMYPSGSTMYPSSMTVLPASSTDLGAHSSSASTGTGGAPRKRPRDGTEEDPGDRLLERRPRRESAPATRELSLGDFPVGKEVRIPRVGTSTSSSWCEVVAHRDGLIVVRVPDHDAGELEFQKVSVRFLLKNTGDQPIVRDKVVVATSDGCGQAERAGSDTAYALRGLGDRVALPEQRRQELKTLLCTMAREGPVASWLCILNRSGVNPRPSRVDVLQTLAVENIPFQALVLQDSRARTWEQPEDTLRALEVYLLKGHTWAINLGETSFTNAQMRRLLDVARESNLAFCFLDSVLVGDAWKRDFKDALRAKRKSTLVAPWLWNWKDPNCEQNRAITTVQKECYLGYGPKGLRRNSRAPADTDSVCAEARVSDGEHLEHLGLATVGDGLTVRDSTIGDGLEAGRGLFADKFFKKGAAVTVYRGPILSKKEAASERIQTHILHVARMQVSGRGRPCDLVGEDIYVLGDRQVRPGKGGGQFANHPPAGTTANVEETIMENSVVLKALTDIAQGQEIFISCGSAEAKEVMMGRARRFPEEIEGNIVYQARSVYQRCEQSDECTRPWTEWSSRKPTGGWRVGDDMGRRADVLNMKVLAELSEQEEVASLGNVICSWATPSEGGGHVISASLSPRARPPSMTAVEAFLTAPGVRHKRGRKGPGWVAGLLQGAGDDAIYLKGRMQDLLGDNSLSDEARRAGASKLLHRDVIPTGMASERGHWCLASTGRLLDAKTRRVAMGWKSYLSALARAQDAADISDETACALELQAVHGAPAKALALLTEWLLRSHPTRAEWMGAEGSFALLGAGAGLWGLASVDAMEAEGIEPSYVLFAECMDSAAAWHDAIYSSVGLLPVRFKWAHGKSLHQCGRRARRVLLSLCCGWISRASPMVDADVRAALTMHAGAMRNIREVLAPDVIWVETSAAILHGDRAQARAALEAILLADPRWQWRRFRLNPRVHFAFPVERDRVFYGGLRAEVLAWPPDDALQEHMDKVGGLFERFSLRRPPTALERSRGERKRAPSTRSMEGPSAMELDRRLARAALAAQEKWETFAFSDPEANRTAPRWAHDGSGGWYLSGTHSVSLPTVGDVPIAPRGDGGEDAGHGRPVLICGPDLALSAEEEGELSQDAFRERYGARLAADEDLRSRGGPMPRGAPRGDESDALLERMRRRGQGFVDRWRYPLREESGASSHVEQLAALTTALKDRRAGLSREERVKAVLAQLLSRLRRQVHQGRAVGRLVA